jgi:predicted transport protein
MTRRRQLGDLGERWTKKLLKDAGFRAVQDLNAVKYNHPGGDFLAERAGKRYFITVKSRNKFVQGGQRLNGGYNIYPKKVRAAAREYDAIPSWLTIQLDTDRRCFSAYFGTIDTLRNPNAVAVPMSVRAVSAYECLASNTVDQAITADLSNQLTHATIEPPSRRASNDPPERASRTYPRRGNPSPRRVTTMALFEDHRSYAEANIRPVLDELRGRITRLSFKVKEKPTRAQRIAYSVARVFAEVKIQKTRILVRVFDMGIPDPRGIVIDIPGTHKWQHQKEIPINSLELVGYAMPFIVASYKSSLTTSPPTRF